MKRFNLSAFAFVLYASLFLTSCGGSDPADPGNRLSGVLTGKMKLFDEYGNEMSDGSGVVVSMEGTSYSATTSADGVWKFDDLPAGTYVVSFTKDGFTTLKIFGYQFVGGGIAYLSEVRLYQLPTYTISDLRTDIVGADTGSMRTVLLTGTFSSPTPANSYRKILFYVSRNNPVSNEELKEVGWFQAVGNHEPGQPSTEFTVQFDYPTFQYRGFDSGERIYLGTYPASFGSSDYYDAVRGEYVDERTTSAPPAVIRLVVP